MFSSGNRSRENSQNYPTQWALNPSAYQNVSNENVDWAALAQQWIMMKESVPPEHPPAARKEILNEGGEAPMDVEVEKEDTDSWPETDNPPVGESWNWQQWGPWPGNWNGPPPPGGAVPPPATVSPINKTALLPTPFTHFAPPGADSNSTTSADFPSFDVTSSNSTDFTTANASSSTSGYWSNSSGATRGGKHPMKAPRVHRKGFALPESRPEMNSEPVTLDAARRRQLPAWIREGLEKMEREKQKQLDRERERIEREEYLNRKKEEKNDALELLRSGDGSGSILPPKSKFDSDSGDSGDEDRNGANNSRSRPQRRRGVPVASPRSGSPPVPITEEERMAMVRRAMTEVLLQVTSSEIESICQEEVNRFRARTPAKKGGRQAAPGAGPAAAGTLGLGMYGGGSSDSDSDSDGAANNGPTTADTDKRSTSNNIDGDPTEHPSTSKRLPPNNSNKESSRRRSSDSQSRRGPNTSNNRSDAEHSSDTHADDGSDSQVDTTRPHGSGTSGRNRDHRGRDRRHRSTTSAESNSSSSNSSSSATQNSKASKKKKSKKTKKAQHSRHRKSSSSSSSDNDDANSTSSDSRKSKSTTSSRDVNKKPLRKPTTSSYSGEHSRTKKRSRSPSSESDSRDSQRRRRTTTKRSSRSRSASSRRRNVRRRSRSRERRYERRRSRSRTRSRDRRDSYRSRRRSRTRSRSRSGGKRSRGH